MATSGKGVSPLRRAWQGPTVLPRGSEAPLGSVAQPTVPVCITQSLGSVAILTLYRRFRERGRGFSRRIEAGFPPAICKAPGNEGAGVLLQGGPRACPPLAAGWAPAEALPPTALRVVLNRTAPCAARSARSPAPRAALQEGGAGQSPPSLGQQGQRRAGAAFPLFTPLPNPKMSALLGSRGLEEGVARDSSLPLPPSLSLTHSLSLSLSLPFPPPLVFLPAQPPSHSISTCPELQIQPSHHSQTGTKLQRAVSLPGSGEHVTWTGGWMGTHSMSDILPEGGHELHHVPQLLMTHWRWPCYSLHSSLCAPSLGRVLEALLRTKPLISAHVNLGIFPPCSDSGLEVLSAVDLGRKPSRYLPLLCLIQPSLRADTGLHPRHVFVSKTDPACALMELLVQRERQATSKASQPATQTHVKWQLR
ncbi:uncharacterized protein LOC144331744 [Macaca mulatta]